MEKSSAVLEKAMRAWSSCSTQQHSSFTLFSHTLVAAVLRPPTNWLASGLYARVGPAEEYRATFRPSGSKTTIMVTTVEPMIIQLQNRADPALRPTQRRARGLQGEAALQDLAEGAAWSPRKFLMRPRGSQPEDQGDHQRKGCVGRAVARPGPALTPQGLRVPAGKTNRILPEPALTGLWFGVEIVPGCPMREPLGSQHASTGDGPEGGSAARGGEARNGTVSMAVRFLIYNMGYGKITSKHFSLGNAKALF